MSESTLHTHNFEKPVDGEQATEAQASQAEATKIPAEDWQRVVDFLEQEGSTLYGHLIRRTGNSDVAAELLQETAIRAARNMGKFTDQGYGMRPWMFMIASNLHSDMHRHKGVVKRVLGDQTKEDPDEQIGRLASLSDVETEVTENVTRSEVLAKVREEVGADFFDAFWVTKVEGFSGEESAEILGARAATIRTRAYRGAKRIKALLQDNPQMAEFLGASRLLTTEDDDTPSA